MALKVINLFGGPGSGKSTTAAGLFHRLKMMGLKVELVTEYAKDLTYERNDSVKGNQLAVLGEQFQRMWRLRDHVDWIVTDSPLLLSVTYAIEPFNTNWFMDTVMGAWNLFDNDCFLLRRAKPYADYGRSQNEDEAVVIDAEIEFHLRMTNTKYVALPGDKHAPAEIERIAIVERQFDSIYYNELDDNSIVQSMTYWGC